MYSVRRAETQNSRPCGDVLFSLYVMSTQSAIRSSRTFVLISSIRDYGMSMHFRNFRGGKNPIQRGASPLASSGRTINVPSPTRRTATSKELTKFARKTLTFEEQVKKQKREREI